MIHRHAVLAIVLFMITGALWAQERQSRRDLLRGLKGALNAAGAPALTTEQEEQLRTLLAEFRQSQGTDGSGAAVREARQAYLEAVLSSDNAGAQLQSEVIANQIAATTVSRLENQAGLKIQFLNILTPDQVGAVLERSGTSGLFRVLGTSGSGRRQGRRPSPPFRR